MAKFIEREGGVEIPVPGVSPNLSSEIWLGYNILDEMIKIRKFINGKIFNRDIIDPDITDYIVDRWVEYKEYTEII